MRRKKKTKQFFIFILFILLSFPYKDYWVKMKAKLKINKMTPTHPARKIAKKRPQNTTDGKYVC